ncbi:MAG: Gfo/Idh/MocA family oxidoreductase [Anaerolineae bacterium]|jgi:predicted dehydrogenase|nr:Gfo/Idh/MocA family oxidoreductase [Anaerolineae bacterium]
MTLKVAIVGMGNIGNRHAQVYVKRDDVEIVAVCDIIPEKANKAAEKYGAKAFYSIQDMIKSGIKIDAASMCTAGEENGGDHYQATIELLEAGIPTLGEKPISNNTEEADEMVALAKRKGLRYGIDLNHRFTPAALKVKEWIEAGRLGEINMIMMRMWINNPNESSPWFHARALHPHSVDILRYFGGDIAKVQTFFKKGEGRKIWSNMQTNLQFKNGIIGHLVGSYDAGGSYGLEQLEIVGSKGRIVLLDACEHLTFYPRYSMQTETYDYLGGMMHFNDTFDARIGKWVEQNLADAAPEEIDGSGEDGLKVQNVIEAMIKSWQTNSIIEL